MWVRGNVALEGRLIIEVRIESDPVEWIVHRSFELCNRDRIDLAQCRTPLASREASAFRQKHDQIAVIWSDGHIPPYENPSAHFAVRFLSTCGNQRRPIGILHRL